MSIAFARILLVTDSSEDAVLAARAAVGIAGKANAELSAFVTLHSLVVAGGATGYQSQAHHAT